MKINLTEREEKVLKAIVKCGDELEDDTIHYVIDDLSKESGLTVASIKGVLGSLEKKGIIHCYAGEYYYDGEVRDIDWLRKQEFMKPNKE